MDIRWILDRIEGEKAVFESESQTELIADLNDVKDKIIVGGSYTFRDGCFYLDEEDTAERKSRIKSKRNIIFNKEKPDR